MQTYIVDIAGEPVTLPIVPINQRLAISLLMVIDMGVHFGERIGKALAARLGPLKPDIVVGAATLGIPVVIESRARFASTNMSSRRNRRRFIWPTRSSNRCSR
jgi:hypothetical protein